MKNEKTRKLFSSKTTRGIVIIAAVLLIGLAVYLNYQWFYDPSGALGYGDNNMDDNFNDSANTDADADEGNDYFTATALTRQQSRDEAIDVLMLITQDKEATEEAKTEAQKKISQIAVDIQNEATIESLVKAKGFEDCIAVIGEENVSVIVKSEAMQAKDTAQVLAIVYETTGVEPSRVSIINK